MSHSNTDHARHVICNALDYNRIPSVVTDNWMRLKEAQGHPITPDRLELLSRISVTVLPAQIPTQSSRITKAVQKIKAARGITRPPHGGDAA